MKLNAVVDYDDRAGRNQRTEALKHRLRKRLSVVTLYLIQIVVAIIILVPFAWMVSSSLKTPMDVYSYPPQWIPNPVTFEHYVYVLTKLPILRYTLNTLIVAGISLIGDILSCSLVAYSFARLRYPFRGALFGLMLATVMLPSETTIIPTFLMWNWLGFVDTYVPLIQPSFTAFPIWVFLIRQYMMGLPIQLDEAAKIDGCGYFRIYRSIILPLCKPVLIVIAVFSFVHHWNNFLIPLVYLNSESKYTLPLGIMSIGGLYYTNWELIMAAAALALIPPLLLYIFFQRYFIRGIALGGVKG